MSVEILADDAGSELLEESTEEGPNAVVTEMSPAHEQKTRKQVEFAPQSYSEDEDNRHSRAEGHQHSRSVTINESEPSGDYDFSHIFPDATQKLIASETPLVDTPIMDELDAERSFSRATATTATTVGELARSAFSGVLGDSGISRALDESFGNKNT